MNSLGVTLGRFGRVAVELRTHGDQVISQVPVLHVAQSVAPDASEASDLPLARAPVSLSTWEAIKLSSAIQWQGPVAIEWINARAARYQTGQTWTPTQCRLTAGLDWELLRLQKSLEVDLQQPARSIHAYFQMHMELDRTCAWITAKHERADQTDAKNGDQHPEVTTDHGKQTDVEKQEDTSAETQRL